MLDNAELASMSKAKPSSSLSGIFINILLPVLILDYCSAGPSNPLERTSADSFWHIGPVYSLILALSLPLIYGIKTLIKTRQFDLMSIVGLVGVLLTGIISIFVIGENGQIHQATPWLFAGKEALIPLIFASAILVSRATETPLLNMFIYTPDLFDVNRIESAITTRGAQENYNKLLANSTYILTGTLIASSIGNFFLSYSFMSAVMLEPLSNQQVAYNEAIGSITWWGFLIIGVPCLAACIFIITMIVNKLQSLTGLTRTDILLK